ncbi:MAG: prepilin-type N-terminal cleavage/methylation domain-containing protein [Magnetococcales bacterium]|nr:prepilin-type N-terminal cleavage/methylation domain-containing protein [Magnetococcales bacterium]
METREYIHSGQRNPGSAGGFTLIEITMVMVILSLLLGGLMLPLATQLENSHRRETKEQLERIHEALLGFALVHGYLPCPDTQNSGRENRLAGGCAGVERDSVWHGTLPWITLGVGEEDAWHNRFRYAVAAPFTDASRSPLPAFDLTTDGNITVSNGIDHAPAIVLSHGANLLGGISLPGVPQPAPNSPAERENSDENAQFSHENYQNDPESGFDDQLIWLSPYLLKNRLLLAGRFRP